MPSKFSALALHGEAFLLETDDAGRRWSILVDGGQSGTSRNRGHPLAKAISRVSPQLRQIDIAICTHNDSDHAGGFPSFLEEWLRSNNRIAEVWLPWRWSAALPTVLTDPDGFMGTLAEGAFQASVQIADRLGEIRLPLADLNARAELGGTEHIIRELGRLALNDSMRGIRAEERAPIHWDAGSPILVGLNKSREIARAIGLSEDDLPRVLRLLEEVDSASTSLTERGIRYFGSEWSSPNITGFRAFDLLRTTTETAEKIRTIAETALHNDILIRWFDFDGFERDRVASGGEFGLLVPLNAIEMEAPRPELDALRLFFSLRLTEQNVESLVFQRVETDAEPGVIFLGDSRLAFGIENPTENFPELLIVPRRSSVITAAHHGSRVNDQAYTVLDNWLGANLASKCHFVRNGGMWKQTLGTYLSKVNRCCAQCHQCFKGGRSQDVVVKAPNGSWLWPTDAKPCGTPRGNITSVRSSYLSSEMF